VSAISLRSISKAFVPTATPVVGTAGGEIVQALDDVSLDVADGEAMAILGPSGCGKSTLLRVVAGLEPPDSGRVLFDGEDVTQVPAQRRGIGMVFQNYALYPHMDSRRNLGFFFQMHRREPEAPERVAAVCEIMGPGFRDLLNRRPNELSGGQQQRVAIGRCVIREPRVFLFDEPLSNLDAKLRAHTRVEIKRLIRHFGITSLYVTHDQTEAMAIADRIAVMRRGRIEQVGRYRHLYDQPVNTFVAGFLGTPPMALLDGVVDGSGRDLRLGGAEPPILLPLPARFHGSFPPGTPLTLGVRPETISLAPAGAPGIAATVIFSEPLFADRQQLVRCALGNPRRPVAEVVARVDGNERIAPGTPVNLALDSSTAHLFAEDGRRL
jgi:ABC-type sugar transport system ATPase subunit